MRSERGFSLIEMMIVSAILLTFLMISFEMIKGMSEHAQRQRLLHISDVTVDTVKETLEKTLQSIRTSGYIEDEVLLPTPLIVPSYYAWEGNQFSDISVCLTPVSPVSYYNTDTYDLDLHDNVQVPEERANWIDLVSARYYGGTQVCDPNYKNLIAFVEPSLDTSSFNIHLVRLQREPSGILRLVKTTLRISANSSSFLATRPLVSTIPSETPVLFKMHEDVLAAVTGRAEGAYYLPDSVPAYQGGPSADVVEETTLIEFPPEVVSAMITLRYEEPLRDRLLLEKLLRLSKDSMNVQAPDLFLGFYNDSNSWSGTCSRDSEVSVCNPWSLTLDVSLLLSRGGATPQAVASVLNSLNDNAPVKGFTLVHTVRMLSVEARSW